MKKAIVVGSGAGGCAVAAELSQHFDVTVFEAGSAFDPFSYRLESLEPMRKVGAFVDERMISALFPAMRVVKAQGGLVHVNGKCVGGTTALATGNAVRCDGVLRELGVNLDSEFARLAEIVPTTRNHYHRWSDLTVRLFDAFEHLGFDPQVTPKFMEDANRCVACGRCVLGCRFGAKWTADQLLNALPQVKLKTACKVERVLVEQGRATGVVFRERGARHVAEADLVVLAAGGLNTPVILNASGFETTPTLFVDPVICVAAPWQNARLQAQLPMPFVSQRDGYILSPYFDWLSFFFNKDWRMSSTDIMSIMVKYADDSEGSFDGKRLNKPVTAHDRRTIERSVEEASLVLEELGIRRDQMFLGTLNAGHPGGCLPLTKQEAETLHHDFLPENLYVADASLLPRSAGNPPMLTIMALATKVARVCNERFGG